MRFCRARTPPRPLPPLSTRQRGQNKNVHCTVGTLAESTRAAGITKTALIVVGDFLAAQYDRSKLYDPAFTTEFRRGTDR